MLKLVNRNPLPFGRFLNRRPKLCFLALENMKQDEEFGEYAEPKMYSYFEEVFKRPTLRVWLGWNDDVGKFTEDELIKEFYSWIVPQGEDNPTPKLQNSNNVRELSHIIGDNAALGILRGPEGTLSRAIARFEVDHPEDWYPKVLAASAAVKSLTPDMLRKMDTPTLTGLTELQQRITQALKDRERLVSVG